MCSYSIKSHVENLQAGDTADMIYELFKTGNIVKFKSHFEVASTIMCLINGQKDIHEVEIPESIAIETLGFWQYRIWDVKSYNVNFGVEILRSNDDIEYFRDNTTEDFKFEVANATVELYRKLVVGKRHWCWLTDILKQLQGDNRIEDLIESVKLIELI